MGAKEFTWRDVIVSVRHRVNSKRGTHFCIWATNVLKQHLVQGYSSIHEKRQKEEAENLKALQRTVQILADIGGRKALAVVLVVRQGLVSDFVLRVSSFH